MTRSIPLPTDAMHPDFKDVAFNRNGRLERVVEVLAANLIDPPGMAFSLTGPLRRRVPPPLPKL